MAKTEEDRSQKNKKSEIKSLIQKFGMIMEKQMNSRQKHNETIQNLLNNRSPLFKELKKLTITELHVIECIADYSNSNVTFLSRKTGLTKSAISKISTRLKNSGLITIFQKENNNKEILFSLTEAGMTASNVHKKFHESEDNKYINKFSEYTTDEIQLISRFLDDLLSLS